MISPAAGSSQCASFLSHSADVWVYPSSDWNRVSTQKMFYLSQFKAVQDEKVYDYQMSGESAWFEQRLAEYGE